jgi:hypothetical protein
MLLALGLLPCVFAARDDRPPQLVCEAGNLFVEILPSSSAPLVLSLSRLSTCVKQLGQDTYFETSSHLAI